MSILSSLFSVFSGGAKQQKDFAVPAAEPQVHQDCLIYAAPIREGSQLRLAGRIEKQVNGETLERVFIRADVFTSEQDALECTFRKARQIIDQNGASLFADGAKSRNV
ncbi:HlyU family transcriptional regulator [Rhizobium arsenicireducens]